jgi:hypothetical protein
MLYPSKADCIAILSAASRVSDAEALLALDHKRLGLSRNAMDAAAAFLTERGCFNRYSFDVAGISVGALSLQVSISSRTADTPKHTRAARPRVLLS